MSDYIDSKQPKSFKMMTIQPPGSFKSYSNPNSQTPTPQTTAPVSSARDHVSISGGIGLNTIGDVFQQSQQQQHLQKYQAQPSAPDQGGSIRVPFNSRNGASDEKPLAKKISTIKKKDTGKSINRVKSVKLGTFDTAERYKRPQTAFENDQSTSASKHKSSNRKIEDSSKLKYMSSMAILENQMAMLRTKSSTKNIQQSQTNLKSMYDKNLIQNHGITVEIKRDVSQGASKRDTLQKKSPVKLDPKQYETPNFPRKSLKKSFTIENSLATKRRSAQIQTTSKKSQAQKKSMAINSEYDLGSKQVVTPVTERQTAAVTALATIAPTPSASITQMPKSIISSQMSQSLAVRQGQKFNQNTGLETNDLSTQDNNDLLLDQLNQLNTLSQEVMSTQVGKDQIAKKKSRRNQKSVNNTVSQFQQSKFKPSQKKKVATTRKSTQPATQSAMQLNSNQLARFLEQQQQIAQQQVRLLKNQWDQQQRLSDMNSKKTRTGTQSVRYSDSITQSLQWKNNPSQSVNSERDKLIGHQVRWPMSSTNKLEGVSRLTDKRNTDILTTNKTLHSASASKMHFGGHSASWTIDEAHIQNKDQQNKKVNNRKNEESGLKSISEQDMGNKLSSKRLVDQKWEESKKSRIGELFMEGMGCDPLKQEIGQSVPKMGILPYKNSQRSFNLQRDASMKSGTFKLSYDQNQLEQQFQNTQGLKMVDKTNLAAFVMNESEKNNNYNISPLFIQQQGRKQFDVTNNQRSESARNETDTPQSKLKGGVDPMKNVSQINLFQDQAQSKKAQRSQRNNDIYYKGGGAMQLILSQVKENHKLLQMQQANHRVKRNQNPLLSMDNIKQPMASFQGRSQMSDYPLQSMDENNNYNNKNKLNSIRDNYVSRTSRSSHERLKPVEATFNQEQVNQNFNNSRQNQIRGVDTTIQLKSFDNNQIISGSDNIAALGNLAQYQGNIQSRNISMKSDRQTNQWSQPFSPYKSNNTQTPEQMKSIVSSSGIVQNPKIIRPAFSVSALKISKTERPGAHQGSALMKSADRGASNNSSRSRQVKLNFLQSSIALN